MIRIMNCDQFCAGFYNKVIEMENDDMELFGEMTFKKESAYLTMLKKRGRYLIKHLRKVQGDFLKKYQNKPSSEKQFLQDVKIMFNIYEVLVAEIISDLQFTELEAFGEGVQKLFQQIVMIVSYLIQSFFLSAHQQDQVRKVGVNSSRTAEFQHNQQTFIETAQQTRKRLYEISEKTFYNLKEESRLYDIIASGDDELHRIQDEVLKNKGAVEAIKESQLQSNLKEAFEYLSQYSAYSRNFLDKAQKRLKEISTDMASLQVTKQSFFQEQTVHRESKQRKARSTCVMINQIKRLLRNDVSTQTQSHCANNYRRSTNNSGIVELRSLQKKHTETTDKLKDQVKELTNELNQYKAKLEEEADWKEKFGEELLQEKDKVDKLNDTINQYKECVKYRDNTIKKIKEDNEELQHKIGKLKEEIGEVVKASKAEAPKNSPFKQIKSSAHSKTDRHIKFAQGQIEQSPVQSKVGTPVKELELDPDNVKSLDQFPSAFNSEKRLKSKKRIQTCVDEAVDVEVMTDKIETANIHTQTADGQVEKKPKSILKFQQISKSESATGSSSNLKKSKSSTAKKLPIIAEQSSPSRPTSIRQLDNTSLATSRRSIEPAKKSPSRKSCKSSKSISKPSKHHNKSPSQSDPQRCIHLQNLSKLDSQLRQIIRNILVYIETQSVNNMQAALKLIPDATRRSNIGSKVSVQSLEKEKTERQNSCDEQGSCKCCRQEPELEPDACLQQPQRPITVEIGTQFSNQLIEAPAPPAPPHGKLRQNKQNSELSESNLSNTFPNTLIRVHTVNSKKALRSKSGNCTALSLLKQARNNSQAPGFVAVPCDSAGSWVNLMPSETNISPYRSLIKRVIPKTANNCRRSALMSTVDKAKIIGEMYKKMLHWRLLNSGKFAELVTVLNLTENTMKINMGYEGFSIAASKFIDQHAECLGKPLCAHIVALMDDSGQQ